VPICSVFAGLVTNINSHFPLLVNKIRKYLAAEITGCYAWDAYSWYTFCVCESVTELQYHDLMVLSLQ